MRNNSSPPAEPSGIDSLIASRLFALRQAKALSLAELAELSGVSKAMISKVERAESSPTAVLLGRLAAGLGVPLAQLLTEDKGSLRRLRTRAEQEVWRDPEAGYLRRQVAERAASGGVEMVEIELPRSAQVAYPRWSGKPYRQCLWMLEGALRVDYGDERFELAPGDCLDFGVDRPLVFKALGRAGCRYLLVTSPA
ncbi:transcriptional regulator with XRE-family HTH domain [Variovorax beijingensis]|jgi:transcriptional regulator with XRE-family HTH domain|uniref:Transcriptional regulator with XRE-family HTH domain n=1 Tax=Variovorax beijingensis TaxID=2496117 RepID=A0A561C530_9BURK|nr:MULTISPECIES: helix-turn-helix domain-containing protein [Variovorax]MBD9668059.1 helix-turn-helix domain-containing protein [Variovorax sp. VRV01]TWD86329.1 transcriptional regulator with XRE-family HTH domain [Variovorax beijingensis]